VPKETNFFIKVYRKENIRRKIQTVKEQATKSDTHIVGRSHRSMGIKGSANCSCLLQTLRGMRVTLLNRGLWRLHHHTGLLRRRFIRSRSINNGSSGSFPFQVLVVTAKGTKSKDFA
jgi:hypothetical protein